MRVRLVADGKVRKTWNLDDEPALVQEVALSQTVFATDYPQAMRDPGEVNDYILAVRDLGPNGRALVNGLNALGIGPRDMISILQAVKAAGALQADIEVM